MKSVKEVMDVRLGWSGDIYGTWTKMDVEVSEVDLEQHFLEAGVQGDLSNLKYSPLEKFKLMYSIAEVCVQLHKISRFPSVFGSDDAKRELAELIQVRDTLTKKILERAPF